MNNSTPETAPMVVLTLQETADRLRVNRKTLASAFNRHPHIPGVVRIGNQWRINFDVFLDAWDRGELLLDTDNNTRWTR